MTRNATYRAAIATKKIVLIICKGVEFSNLFNHYPKKIPAELKFDKLILNLYVPTTGGRGVGFVPIFTVPISFWRVGLKCIEDNVTVITVFP